jgi:hypothetical protein
MHRIGGAIQCALKALGVSKVDHAMSGYAAQTRPTGLRRPAHFWLGINK